MRTSKIAALVAATALLVVGSAIAAFAATNGWVEESGAWKYYKNGEAQTETFAKSGDNWYWLDENGEMATDKLVSYNDYLYYVDENGVMVKNTWKELANTDDDSFGDTVWYYFQSTGKAYKAGSSLTWKTINGKKYTFNDDSKMLYGWLDSTGTMVDDSDNNAFLTGLYYCGAADDGARRTSAWESLYCVNTADDVDGNKWFYFGANGKKTYGTTAKTINGKKYAFADEDKGGYMLAEWVTTAATSTTLSTALNNSARYAWFQDAETGAKYANGWFKVTPASDLNATDASNEDQHWYYADSKGVLAKSTIKTIKSKQYAFNEKGEMQSGLQWVVEDDGVYTFTPVDDGTDSIAIDKIIEPEKAWENDYYYLNGSKTGLHFFSDDADNDGSMKTGTVKTTVAGDEYTFRLGTKGSSKGVGYSGKDSSYVYLNGYKFVADADMKAQCLDTYVAADSREYACDKPFNFSQLSLTNGKKTFDYTDDAGYKHTIYVISTSGAIVKSGTKTDADGWKVKVSSGEIVEVYNTNVDTKNPVWPK